MIKPEILFLQQEDVIKAGLLDMKKVLDATEYTFKMLGEGKVIQPNKVKLPIPDELNWTSFGMSMPAYIGGDDPVIGFKWAAESVYNSTLEGVPYGIDMVLLSDPKTMFPKAIMDGTIITAMRTSAAAGVCAKYAASQKSEKAVLVGAGVIGRTMIMAMMEAVANLKEIVMVDLDTEKARQLADEFKGKYNVKASSDLQKEIKDADIVVTETTSRKDFIPKAWLKRNATVIQMESHAFEPEVVLGADKLIIDSWGQMTILETSFLKPLVESGKLKQEDVSPVQDVVTGAKKGRENEDEFIMCATKGMGSVDISVANMLYKEALKMGLGQKLHQWDNPLWV